MADIIDIGTKVKWQPHGFGTRYRQGTVTDFVTSPANADVRVVKVISDGRFYYVELDKIERNKK